MRSWEEQKPAKTVRSSIACVKCRRSKIKCVNNGVNSTCKTCASANRECTYPAPGSMPNPRRNEFTPGVRPEEGETKKRNRKVDDSGRRNFHKITEDALDLPLLTKKVWHEIFEIFKLHFSTEMPFLHPPTFKNRMRQASNPRDPTVPATGPQEGKVLLLGVLTLTARFHPELVAYHSPSGDALAASGYYAEALKVAFGPTSGNLTNPSLDVIQACLMLSLYEWGQAQGRSGWVYVGIATRLAQSIGLPYEDDADPPKNGTQQNGLTRTMLAEKEIRRRTWWSCFIMDRMLSAGRYRPTMIDVEKLRVQLPCSDDQFLFVSKARTPSLNASWPREEDPEASSYDYSALGWYIRLVEIFGRFSEWSFAGGRRTEKLPPWERESHFSRIREELQTFQLSLPASLAYTTENLSAHIEKRNATVYASMHTLFALCQIMLHREHIPFIPLRSRRPSGPLDEPTFPPSKHSIPEGFWEESAATMFKAAKEITNIVQTCQEDNALPESAMIGFAIWQASFVCLYSCHFPHMDTAGSFHPDPDHLDNANAPNWLEVTSGLLNDLSPRLSMVKGHQKTLRKMHDYFKAVKKTYNDHIETGDKIFPGGDADGYSHHRKELREFGNLEDQTDRSDKGGRSRASSDENTSSAEGEFISTIEVGQKSWATVNQSDPEERLRYEQPQYSPFGVPSASNAHGSASTRPAVDVSNGSMPSTPKSESNGIPSQVYHTVSPLLYSTTAQAAMAPPPSKWPPERQHDFMAFFDCMRWPPSADCIAQGPVEWSPNAYDDGDSNFFLQKHAWLSGQAATAT